MKASPVMQRFLARLLCLAVVFTFTAGADSCSSGEDAGPTFVTDIAIKNAAGAVTREFDPGEPITFELSVRNRTRNEAILQFPSGYQFDFVVFAAGLVDGNRPRWRWSFSRSFLQALTEIEFAAEETKTFTVIWDQRDDAGFALSPGTYEARGVMVFSEFASDPLAAHQLGSPIRPFTLR